MHKTSSQKGFQFLSGGGEMGNLTRNKDWSKTAIGDPSGWPQSLRTTISILLNSKFPMFLWWGNDLTQFYNDAYRPSLGENGKHPEALGQKGKDCWPEIWAVIYPLITQVLKTGEPTWSEDQLIPIYRNGKLEDVYWTFSYSPVTDEDGCINGVLVVCNETTDKILAVKKLSESSDQLRFTIDAAELGTWDLNPATNTFLGNERLKKWFGLNPSDQIDLKNAIDSIVPADRERVTDAIAQALRPDSGGNYEIEYTIVHPMTGKQRTVLAKGKALFSEDGVAYRFSGILQDINERKDIELAFRRSEEKFRNTVSQAPIGIIIMRGPDCIVELANATYLQIVDQQSENFVGRSLYYSLPEVTSAVKPILDNVLKTGEPYYGVEFEVPLNRYGKKETTYFNFVYHPLRDPDETINGVIVIATEVTAQVLATHALMDSEKQFRNLVTQSPIAMGIFRGEDHIIELANETLLKTLWRREISEVQGKKLLEVFPELKGQKFPELMSRVLNTGIAYKENEAMAIIDGNDGKKTFYLDYEYAPFLEKDKTISGIMVTVNDVTEKVVIRQQIKDAADRLLLATEGTQIATWDLNLETRDIIHSPRQAVIFGHAAEKKMTHIEMRKQIHGEDLPMVEKAFDKALKNGVYFYEARVVQPDNSIKWIRTSGKAIFDDAKKPVRMLGTIMDITEQKLNEKLKAEHKEQLEVIINAAELGTWEINLQTKEIAHSPRYLEIVGLDPNYQPTHEELLKRLHPDDIQLRDEAFKRGMDTGFLDYVSRLIWPDYSIHWVEAKGKLFYDEQKKPLKFIGTLRDLTKEKNYQQRIEESESRLRIAALSGELGTWDYNPATNVLTWDNATRELFGVSPEEIITTELFFSRIHPDDVDMALKKMQDSLNPEIANNYDAEYRVTGLPGNPLRWIHAKGKALFDDNNLAHRFSGTVLDITEKKVALDELKENEQRYRFLANSMPQFVWTGGSDGILNYFNNAVYDYSGLTQENIAAGGWLGIVHPDDREENIKRWIHSITTGEPFLFEHRFRRKDGTYRWQLSRATAQKDEEGKIRMWVGTSTDIDDLKKHEQQKNDFIKMANHELKTPVTTIKGYVQLLMKTHSGSEDTLLTNSLATVDKQVTKLTNLVSDLLDVTKIERGSLPLSKEKFRLNDLISDTIRDMAAASKTHTIVFDPKLDATVMADRERISQVLLNLFTNAFKYSPKADEVLVNVKKEKNMVVISVQDFGIGIAGEDQGKIFDRFYRVSGKDEKTFPGFGIGLFIVNEIISLHDGKLWVKSEKDKGATFYFSLPVIDKKKLV